MKKFEKLIRLILFACTFDEKYDYNDYRREKGLYQYRRNVDSDCKDCRYHSCKGAFDSLFLLVKGMEGMEGVEMEC
jgi:hypothetical protein